MKKEATYFKRPAPPQSGHKKRCAIGRGGPLYKEKEGLHQSPCQTEKSKIESKSRRIFQTFVLHSMSRTRRAVAQFLATSWIFSPVFFVFNVHHLLSWTFSRNPCSTCINWSKQSNWRVKWVKRLMSTKPARKQVLQKGDFQSKDKPKIAKDLKRSGVYP